jgi:hypothetical protein
VIRKLTLLAGLLFVLGLAGSIRRGRQSERGAAWIMQAKKFRTRSIRPKAPHKAQVGKSIGRWAARSASLPGGYPALLTMTGPATAAGWAGLLAAWQVLVTIVITRQIEG